MSNKDWCVAGARVRTLDGDVIKIFRVTDDNGVWSSGGSSYCRTELTPLDNGLHGYRWGVPYEANGKSPDLPDDLWLMVQLTSALKEIYFGDRSKCVNFWKFSEHFRITDERYKPADTGYLDKPQPIKGVPVEVDMIAQAKYEFSQMSPAFKDLMQDSFDKVIAKMESEKKARVEKRRALDVGLSIWVKSDNAIDALSELYDLGYLVIPSSNN